jgi:hypothetical protein
MLGTLRASLASLGSHRVERGITPGDDDLPGRIDVGNIDGQIGGPSSLHDAFHLDFVEALDGGEAIAAREGRLHQFATQTDERQGISEGQRAASNRRTKGADRHASDGRRLDLFGHQGTCRGNTGNQQRGLDGGG